MSAAGLVALVVGLATAPLQGPGVGPDSERRLAFANLYSLGWNVLSGIPSGEVSVTLGSSLRPRFSRRGYAWRTALGYEIAGSVGGADYYAMFFSWGGDYGLAYHRHHLAAFGFGGRKERLYYHFGGGLLMWRSTPVALEADVRLGATFGPARNARVRGVAGGQVRIVGVLGGVPLPHLSLFVGILVF